MSQEEINTCNEIIANFMGIKAAGDLWYFSKDETGSKVLQGYHSVIEIRFATSWDWLMPVVKKIINMDNVPSSMDWQGSMFMFPLTACVGRVEIVPAFKLCVQYITWYNKQR